MKPTSTKLKSSLRTKAQGRTKNVVRFKESEEIKSRESWFEYMTDSYHDQNTKREIKRERHHKLIEDLRSELSLVQNEIETSSRGIAWDLQKAIDEDLDLINEKYQHIKDMKIEQAEMKHNLDKEWAEATKLLRCRKDATDTFCKTLIDIEETRWERVKTILDKFQELFVKNEYLDSSEVQALFDYELMNVNDEKLKNVLNYRDQGERYHHSTDKHLNALQSLCTEKMLSWKDYLVSSLQLKIKMTMNFNLSETILDSKQFTHLQHSFECKLKELDEQWNPSEVIFTNRKTFKPWIDSQETIIDSIDYTARDLIQEYEAFLKRQCIECEESVKDLQESMMNNQLSSPVDAELFTSSLRALNEQAKTIVDDLKIRWGTLIFNILEEIDYVKEIFTAGEDLRKKYKESLVDLQTRTYDQISSEKENLTSLCEKEEDSHIEELVKRIMTALNVQMANDLLAEINNIYEEKKRRSQDSYNKTVKILDTFLETLKTEFHPIRGEIKASVSLYGEKNKYSYFVNINDEAGTGNGKPAFLLLTQKHIESIQESKTRILSVLENEFPAKLENDCIERANVWALSKRQTIRKEFEERMSRLSSRWDYFRNAVYAPRLEEIREHADYFNKHKETINNFSPEIELETLKTLAELNDVNIKSNMWIEATQERSCIIYRSSDVQSILSLVFKKEEEFKLLMRNITDKYVKSSSTKEEGVINNNFDFVQKLLSLAEQDLYTNEEVSAFCDDLFKLEKEIISKSQSFKADVLKRSCLLVDETQKRLSLLLESLHQRKADLSFIETVVQFVRDGKTQLKKLALSLKYSGKLLSYQIEEIAQITERTFWTESAKTVILERWKLLLESLKIRKNLLLEDPEENASNSIELNDDITFSSYVSLLVSLSNSRNSFLYKIHDVLHKSVEQIEEVAKNFYMGKDSRKTSLPEHVHQTYNDLMTEIIQKYNNYMRQCQLEWFKELCDFVDTIALFKEGINSYVDRLMSDLHAISVEIMETPHKDMIRNVTTIHNEGNHCIREISTYLKPVHGHPENEQLLNELQIQFDKCCTKYQQMSEENVQKYMVTSKEILENVSSDVRLKLSKLKSTLPDIFNGKILLNIIQDVKKQFAKVYRQFPSREDNGFSTDKQHTERNGISFDLEISLPSNGTVTNYSSVDILQIESTRLKLTALSEEEDCRVSHETWLNTLEESISKFEQDLQEMYAQTGSELQRIDSAFKSSIQEARFEWDINVHSIKSMFTLPINE